MDILGIGAGWIPVAGLALDMTGVGILAYDLFPEYRLYKAGRELRGARESIVEYRSNRDWRDARERDTPSDELAVARLDHARLGTKLALMGARSHLLMAAHHLKVSVPDAPLTEFGDPAMRAEKEIELLQSLYSSRQREDRKYRPPIGFGVSLIIGGFFLQIIGVVPF